MLDPCHVGSVSLAWAKRNGTQPRAENARGASWASSLGSAPSAELFGCTWTFPKCTSLRWKCTIATPSSLYGAAAPLPCGGGTPQQLLALGAFPDFPAILIMGGAPGVRMGWNAPPTQWSPRPSRWQKRWRDWTSCPAMFLAPPDDVRKKLSKLGFAKSAPCHVGSVSCWIRVMPKRRNERNPTAHGKRSPGLVSIVFGFGGKV